MSTGDGGDKGRSNRATATEQPVEVVRGPALRIVQPELRTEPDVFELWVVLADGLRGSVRELTEWGLRLALPRETTLDIAETYDFDLRDASTSHVRGRARVVGFAEYDLGYEAILWIVDGLDRWNVVAPRLAMRARMVDLPPPPDRMRLPPSRITRRLSALTAERARARVRSLGSVDGLSLPARLDPESGILLEYDPRWGEMKAPFEINVDGPFSTVRFIERSIRWKGQVDPRDVTVHRRRQMRRVRAPSGAKVILVGPSGEPIDLKMEDVSFGGVSARLADRAPSIEPGTSIPEVVVTWKGGPGLRFVGDVRHRSPSPYAESQMIGLALSGAPDVQAERWAREVENLLYPTTRSFGHDYQSLWELFEASGYFDLSGGRRQSQDFQMLRDAFESSYRRLAAAPHLGCLVSYESPTRVEATLAGLRVWTKSWFGLHMARNADRPHLVNSDSAPLKDIHFHVYERAGANEELEWLIGYVRDDAGFSKVLHREFVLSMPGAVGVPFEAWKLKVSMCNDTSFSHVQPATTEQVGEVLAALQHKRPRAYLEAHDLEPETFYQDELRTEWEAHGLMRERTALVAIENGRIVAAAVLDAVEDGLHLYGLLDAARLFELEPGGARHFPILLVAANEWFFAMGKSSFICFDELGRPDIMRSVSAKSLGSGMLTLLPRRATPDLLERISELAAPK